MTGWATPVHSSRVGASHRRRGTPCQDSGAVRRLRSLDGATVWAVAVADGHGHQRHRLSEFGSRLACREAVEAVARQVAARSVRRRDTWPAWEDWLREELPAEIHRRWLEAVAADWDGRASAEGEAFAAELYGSTLGLLVLTPHWWGHTGIGDWDLVRVESGGAAELLDEEGGVPGRGEATHSLCQPRAADCFRSRARWHPVPPGEPPFALLLSTDGIRKSCCADADFLALATHLARSALPLRRGEAAIDLEATLDRITADGSGDDVTVAIAVRGRPRLPPEGTAESGTAGGGFAGRDGPGRGRVWPLLIAVLALVGSAGSIGYTLGRWTAAHERPSPAPAVDPLLVEGGRLCRAAPGPPPASERPTPGLLRIRGALTARRSQFDGLRSGRIRPEALRAAAATDPLGALIAASFDPRSRDVVPRQALETLAPCPALQAELRRQWQQASLPSSPPDSPPAPP